MDEPLTISPIEQPQGRPAPSRRFSNVVMGALVIIVVALISWNAFRVQKWEYKIEAVNDLTFTTDINKLGDEGWELVFARRASSGSPDSGTKPEFSYEMIFKRRR